jgi:A/G-specific adenine glycosylase
MVVAALPALPPLPAFPAEARTALLDWYDRSGRSLAFRASRDPWSVLVSEVMAQQTQVPRVETAWIAFMRRYPTPTALAASTPAEVLREWQGMGYNRRALNLRRAAIVIRDQYGGAVPGDVEALDALPGIGPYTARAVAAIAFGQPVGPLDTNVRRVLVRVLGPEPRFGAPADLQAVADASVDPARSGDWTHAMMDVGATLCRPRATRCEACPLRPWCASAGLPATQTPAPRSRTSSPAFPMTSRWLRGRIVDRLRSADDGLWTVVAGPIGVHDSDAVANALSALERDGLVELDPREPNRARLATA